MILLDTNVLIYAFASESPFQAWARGVIADHASSEGVVINAVCLAELCVGDADPGSVAGRIRSYGVSIVDVPATCAAPAAAAYQRYLENRRSAGHGPISWSRFSVTVRQLRPRDGSSQAPDSSLFGPSLF